METELDHTYLRPGVISRAAAVGLAAVGAGAGMLLACWGLSFFFHYDDPMIKKLDILSAQVEALAQKPDQAETVIQKLSRVGDNSKRDIEAIRGSIVERLASIEKRLDALRQPSTSSGRGGKTIDGNVIEEEVTVFKTVKHERGTVQTGWKYKDGASDGRPFHQYCLYMSEALGGTTASATIFLANDGVRLPNIAPMPHVEEALRKCVWWTGS
jgi:hypothetical protein